MTEEETPTPTGDATGARGGGARGPARRASNGSERRRSRSRWPTCSASRRPDRTGAVRAAHAELGADTVTEDVVTVAGRVVLKRDMGKLKFVTLRDATATSSWC